jgi:hypothetical protein
VTWQTHARKFSSNVHGGMSVTIKRVQKGERGYPSVRAEIFWLGPSQEPDLE